MQHEGKLSGDQKIIAGHQRIVQPTAEDAGQFRLDPPAVGQAGRVVDVAVGIVELVKRSARVAAAQGSKLQMQPFGAGHSPVDVDEQLVADAVGAQVAVFGGDAEELIRTINHQPRLPCHGIGARPVQSRPRANRIGTEKISKKAERLRRIIVLGHAQQRDMRIDVAQGVILRHTVEIIVIPLVQISPAMVVKFIFKRRQDVVIVSIRIGRKRGKNGGRIAACRISPVIVECRRLLTAQRRADNQQRQRGKLSNTSHCFLRLGRVRGTRAADTDRAAVGVDDDDFYLAF